MIIIILPAGINKSAVLPEPSDTDYLEPAGRRQIGVFGRLSTLNPANIKPSARIAAL